MLTEYWGVVYEVSGKEAEENAVAMTVVFGSLLRGSARHATYISLLLFFTLYECVSFELVIRQYHKVREKQYDHKDPMSSTPVVSGVMVRKVPRDPTETHPFHLEKSLLQLGCEDKHVMDLANEVRCILAEEHISIAH
ncbi:hypothetical protein RJ641_029391 [Dillenia turbinata]|uniref:Uncharacterized protein n=1 Tax=Dillenia turbinata TaxID=194707 RepID=A0AAN8VTB7_9MAGN